MKKFKHLNLLLITIMISVFIIGQPTFTKGASSGFKSGSISSTKSSTSASSTKSVNTNSSALTSIHSTYSSHSVSNNYYYNTSIGGINFWSNYWLYRTLTPTNRTIL